MSEYPDASHPTPFWQVQALWPPLGKERTPTWRAVFFDSSREGVLRSMDWALDQEDGHLGRALDFRVAPPTTERLRAGNPWDSPAQRRRAAKTLLQDARTAEKRQASTRPSPEPEKAPEPATARPAATPARRARAAERFQAATRRQKASR